MTWEAFTKIFVKKWFPPGVRTALTVSFETLKNDTISFSEHNIKFERISHYAPHLIPMNDDKIDHLALGLIPVIQKYVTCGRRNTPYADFMDLALDLERIHQE